MPEKTPQKILCLQNSPFMDQNFRSVRSFLNNNTTLTAPKDYESVDIRDRLEMPFKTYGLIDVVFCDEEKYKSRLCCLTKNGVLRVIQLPL